MMLQFDCDQVSAVRGGLDSPPTVTICLVGFDVPEPRVAGIDSDDLNTVIRRIQDVEIPPHAVLDGPAIIAVLNLPLKSWLDQGCWGDIGELLCTIPFGWFVRGIRSQGRSYGLTHKGREQCSSSCC